MTTGPSLPTRLYTILTESLVLNLCNRELSCVALMTGLLLYAIVATQETPVTESFAKGFEMGKIEKGQFWVPKQADTQSHNLYLQHLYCYLCCLEQANCWKVSPP